MRALVVGLGSMGKRRIRNLRALGVGEIAGVDPRADRRAEAAERYAVSVHADLGSALDSFKPDALVISTPPQHHMEVAWQGQALGLPCFIEASVVEPERILELHELTARSPLLMAPSCTMRYFPGPRRVKELLRANAIGRVLNVSYQTGQYLPDWHPWEPIESFYVSTRASGGCREIVPFELTWLNDLFGEPEPLACVKSKLTDLPADIDDIYHCVLRYPGPALMNMTVEVISRPVATRELRILGTHGQIVFSADENCVRYARSDQADWQRTPLGGGSIESGYINPEEPYIAELADFLAAVRGGDKSLYPNTLLDDYRVLRVLGRLEQLSEGIR
jgi:predicted dehydrogenase